jgi:hypothetical protein
MRFSKAVILLLLAVSLIVVTVPALAWDGGGRWPDQIAIVDDHPWQDDNQGPTGVATTKHIVVVGYSTISVVVTIPSWLDKIFYSGSVTPTAASRTFIVKTSRTTSKGTVGVVRRSDLI